MHSSYQACFNFECKDEVCWKLKLTHLMVFEKGLTAMFIFLPAICLRMRTMTPKSKQTKRVYMLWKECMPSEFYKYICLEENFLHLNRKNVLYLKVADIILKFIEGNEQNYNQLLYITFVNLRTYFNMSTQMCLLKFIGRLKREALIWKVNFI